MAPAKNSDEKKDIYENKVTVPEGPDVGYLI